MTCEHLRLRDNAPHPTIQSFEPGESWKWCYLHEIDG